MGVENVGTYSFSDCQLLFNEQRITEFHDGGIVWTPNEPSFIKYVGPDGSVSRAFTGKQSGIITVALKNTALDNKVFSDAHQNDIVAKNNIVPIAMADPLGVTELFAAKGWIQGWADITWNKEIVATQWIIELARIDTINIGGNGE